MFVQAHLFVKVNISFGVSEHGFISSNLEFEAKILDFAGFLDVAKFYQNPVSVEFEQGLFR